MMNGWTEAQWQMIGQTVKDEIDDSRLADIVIPEYSVESSDRAVPADTFDYESGRVDDISQTPLEERQELFSLTRAQAEDKELSSAQVIVRRAAQRLARDDDTRVFQIAIRDAISAASTAAASAASTAAAKSAAAAAKANFQGIVKIARVHSRG
jgi:hypothetical protein